MTEQVTGAPSAEERVEPVAQQPTPAPTSDDAALRTKLELVQQDNLAKGEANRKLNERVGELERSLKEYQGQLKSTQQQKLAESGEYKKLWEDANADNARLQQRITELEAALQAKEGEAAKERLRATALQQISQANALAPEQLLGLLQPQLRENNGTPVVIVNGIEQPLAAHLASLRNSNSGWDHHFAPSGARGMGSTPSANDLPPGTVNPYKRDTYNFTEVLRLERDNPELARLLKAEATRG
jgi:hypothetical protein